jgi:2-polyprenyl-3-methyl-5-hydroxy-6-metoxy-1,4-benzoquinol methylase
MDEEDRLLADRLLEELAYQAGHAEHIELSPRDNHVIERYRRCRHWRLFPGELMFRHLHAAGLAGKRVLDFGCGDGVVSTLLAQFRAYVTGLDVSPELISVAKRRAQLDGVQDRVEFVVQDIDRSPLEAGRFDILVCHAALHHVDATLVPPLIAALKPGGLAVIVEPIAFSPALQWLRDSVPVAKDVSPGERQLSQREICAVAALLREPHLTFFNLFGRVSRFLPYAQKIDHRHRFTRAVVLALFGTDRLILDIAPAVSKFCGSVVIAGNAR